jgi:hypothetical protein
MVLDLCRLFRGYQETELAPTFDLLDTFNICHRGAFILIPTAARRQRLPSQCCHVLLRGLAFRRVTQEAHGARRREHEEVFAGVTRLLAPVRFLLRFGVGWAVDWTVGAILPKRAMVALSSVACVLNSAANSSAVRAGRRSWLAQA